MGSRWRSRGTRIATAGAEVVVMNGIAEADMQTAAAMMAAGGLKPQDIAATLRLDVLLV